MKRLQFCLVVFAVLTLTFSAFAQVQNGQFTGTVLDPTGAAVAGAKVTVTNPAIGITVSTTSNSSGNYSVKELPVGSYKLTAEAAGFKTYSDNNVVLNAGVIAHVDFKLQIGKASEVVEVTGAAAEVNTEDSKLATTVSSTQINNLPLNGRNVFDLMQMSAGAVNVNGVDFEGGHGTVVNGVREDFNGFLINGVSNKGLSGGAVNVPIEDSVEEFQQLQLNMSAQYGNSAGGTVNLVTKGGTNAWHGSGWEYIRNNAFDANDFFSNQSGVPRAGLHFNQFGLTVGGPIIKDKLFFFLSLQGDRYNTIAPPGTILQESKAWRDAVIGANTADGLNSTAAALYAVYPTKNPGTPTQIGDKSSVVNSNTYFGADPGKGILPDYSSALCLTQGFGGYTTLQHQKLIGIFGVTSADVTNMVAAGCGTIPGLQNPTIDRTASIQETSVATFGTQTDTVGGNLFNGNEGSLRVDYNWNTNNRTYLQFNYNRETDKFGACTSACSRGFSNPTRNLLPQGSFSFVHTFSPSVLNEFRAGYLQNNTAIGVSAGGIPLAGFSDGTALLGSYNGYPQSFKENIYTYSDMVSIGHGNHNMKIGVDFRRNIENSEFNVARPSYYFYDQVAFSADAPYLQAAGVDPGICKAPCPVSSYNPNPQAQLTDNLRHWRNIEFGAYFQDDWKVNKRLTLNLGIRYDLYQRHHEEANLATTFIMGPSTPNSFILGPSNALTNQLYNANNPTTCVANGGNLALAQLVGGCGPGSGGFSPSASLGQGDHNNFGPRVGFAWDVFGDGKTALRGGFGVAYEGTLYNPLSNSRWDLPYYSFNEVIGGVEQPGTDIVYGPSVCDGTGTANCHQVSNVPVAFTGANLNPNQGPANQAQAQGNITGWDPTNPNQAQLTGIILPKGVRDPYVYNFYLGIQHEIMPKTVLDVKYVGTAGHKLFRAEDINRQPGTYLPVDPVTGVGATVVDNFGRTLTGLGARTDPTQPYVSGRLNQNYQTMRTWENAVNSNYSSLQASVKHQMSHGLLFNVDYTYSHTIDNGSTWHSGATTSNGAGAGDGYTLDATQPGLDRGNSIFDIRHRLVVNYVYQLPGQNLKGAAGAILGGWSYNGIWALQSGAHFEPYTSSLNNLCEPATCGNPVPTPCTVSDIPNNCTNIGGDFNLDGVHNDRPNSSVSQIGGVSHDSWANGWGRTKISNADGSTSYQYASPGVTFSTPCLGCTGNLGRNTFVGPGQWFADMTLSKTFKFTERVNMKFDANGFNVFNHTNFVLATAGGNAHNKYTSANFGQAAGTLSQRVLQLGLKISF
jgi:outer membrane receptor protein involved in Fe transport